ncbi:hypothetical protein AB833_03220 [Chromatiales bacterium (ex Bugula neritina AB1)]|nr:hypothetical protein AB833_03220 [Chromatiales bacterium (ex Bugula neritina AB1)]
MISELEFRSCFIYRRLFRLKSVISGTASTLLKIVILGNLFFAQENYAQDAVKISLIGDSITQGGNSRPSFRAELWNLLKQGGYDVDFVGSTNTFFGSLPPLSDQNFDLDHEGHWAWEAGEVADNIDGWLESYTPDIALIHLGTNDLDRGQATTGILSEIARVFLSLRADNPDVKILLAEIIPMRALDTFDFNADLRRWASAQQTLNSPVIVVDQYTGYDALTDNYDNYHPNATGEKKIADKWFKALQVVLDAPAEPDTMQLLGSWSFDEGTGSTAADQSTENNSGTLLGHTWASGRRNSGVCFGGDDGEHMTTVSGSVQNLESLTLSGWIKPTLSEGVWGWVAGFGDSVGLYVDRDGGLVMYVWTGSGWPDVTRTPLQLGLGGQGLKDGAWHHVAGSYDPVSGFGLYVDGKQVGTESSEGPINYGLGGDFRVGSMQGERTFAGCLDEIQLHGKALTEAEIVSVMGAVPPVDSNQAPLVDAGVDRTIELPVNSVLVSARVTDDGLPVGSVLTADWNQISGPSVSVPAASVDSEGQVESTFTFSTAGRYEFNLQASDGRLSGSDRLVVVVNAEGGVNDAPVAMLISSMTSGDAPLAVDFDASGSTDDGGIVSYEWEYGDGGSSTGVESSVSYLYAEAGSYTARVTVTDDQGKSDSVSVGIEVNSVEPPVYATILVNEFLAKNVNGIADGNGVVEQDWIELYNPEEVSVDLAGWCLRDDTEEWCFPDSVLAVIDANDYLLVFASGDGDTSNDPLYLHTNFKLSKGGESLVLQNPNGETVDAYTPFPEQETDQSYGRDNNGNRVYFATPTPGSANGDSVVSAELRFDPPAMTVSLDNRLSTLISDGGQEVPYTLVVTGDNTDWISARTANDANGLTDDSIVIEIDDSGLEPGSYIAEVTAQATGHSQASLEVGFVVPQSAGSISEWEKADVRLRDVSLGADDVGRRLFHSIGPGYVGSQVYSGNLTYDENAGYQVAINDTNYSSGSEVIFNNLSYRSVNSIQLYKDGNLVHNYSLVHTNLPVVAIKAVEIVDEPELPGVLQFMSEYHGQVTPFVNMSIEYRGGTAQRYPKKPYKLEFVETSDLDTTDGLDVQFPGMRNDDDWILDAAYRDTTFVRNLVAMDMWNDIRNYAYLNANGEPEGQPALKGILVEVIRNNEYYGIHVLQETVDRKLFDLTKGADSTLFKASTNSGTFEFLNSVREDFEQKYPDYPEIDNFVLLEEVIALTIEGSDQEFIDGIAGMIDMDNAVDYWIFNVATMAVDNVKKNYFIYRNNTGLLNFAPWDFDATFGMHWTGEIYPNDKYWPDANGGDCLPRSAPNCNLLFSRLNSISPEFKTKVVTRWNELKNTIYTVQAVSDRFQFYHDQLVPIENDTANAFTRNKDRWPDSGASGRDTPEVGTVNWIADFFSDRRDYVDGRINSR